MEKNITIELRVQAPESTTADDAAGYGIVMEQRRPSGQFFLLTPAVIPGFNPQPDPPVAESHDTAGYALQSPAAVDSIYQLSPRFAVVLTLPDPALPVVQTEDVRGFLRDNANTLDSEKPGTGGNSGRPVSDWGPLAIGAYIGNCCFIFGQAVANG